MALVPSKSVKTSYSGEFVASNDDLLTQILLRLPLKSIARFRSVSKHWLSLISITPQFALPKPALALLLYHRTNPSNLDLLRLREHETTPYISHFRPLPFFSDGPLCCIQSCNGLLLCSQRIGSKITYYVYNPTTVRYHTLPPLLQLDDHPSPFASIAYDPHKSPYYKVFCFRHLSSSIYTFQLAIYSSETCEWRISVDSFTLKFCPRSYKIGVFWNTAIHWMTKRGSYRFQVEDEKILDNPMPPIANNRERGLKYFGVSGDRLCLIKGAGPLREHLNIYEMESDCSSWCLKYRLHIGDDLGTSFPAIIWRTRYRNFWIMFLAQSNVDDQEPFLVVQIRNQVVCYYFNSRTFRKIHDLPLHHFDPRNRYLMDIPRSGAYQYIESLSPV